MRFSRNSHQDALSVCDLITYAEHVSCLLLCANQISDSKAFIQTTPHPCSNYIHPDPLPPPNTHTHNLCISLCQIKSVRRVYVLAFAHTMRCLLARWKPIKSRRESTNIAFAYTYVHVYRIMFYYECRVLAIRLYRKHHHISFFFTIGTLTTSPTKHIYVPEPICHCGLMDFFPWRIE